MGDIPLGDLEAARFEDALDDAVQDAPAPVAPVPAAPVVAPVVARGCCTRVMRWGTGALGTVAFLVLLFTSTAAPIVAVGCAHNGLVVTGAIVLVVVALTVWRFVQDAARRRWPDENPRYVAGVVVSVLLVVFIYVGAFLLRPAANNAGPPWPGATTTAAGTGSSVFTFFKVAVNPGLDAAGAHTCAMLVPAYGLGAMWWAAADASASVAETVNATATWCIVRLNYNFDASQLAVTVDTSVGYVDGDHLTLLHPPPPGHPVQISLGYTMLFGWLHFPVTLMVPGYHCAF